MSPSNQTITWTNFEYSSVKYWDIQPRAMPQEMLKISILDMRLEITNLRLQPYLSFLYIRAQGPRSSKSFPKRYNRYRFRMDQQSRPTLYNGHICLSELGFKVNPW